MRKLAIHSSGLSYDKLGKALQKMQGATLIEALVALLLLSFVLLGIAGLLGATTRYQLGVNNRSATTMFFDDLTNRIRSNSLQGAAYVYNTTSWANQQSAIAAVNPQCGPNNNNSCTPAQRAAYDIWELRTLVQRNMPQGGILINDINNDNNVDNGFTLSFIWFDKDYLSDLSTLKQSISCNSSWEKTDVRNQSCCPDAADVSSTPGVRCLNFTFIR